MTPEQLAAHRDNFERAMVAAGYETPERGVRQDFLYERDQDRFVGWKLAMGDESIARTQQCIVNSLEHLQTQLKDHSAAIAFIAAQQSAQPVAFDQSHIDYINRYGGRCRDCADENGVCPSSGLPCADSKKAIQSVLDALAYGLNHKYLQPLYATAQPVEVQHMEKLASELLLKMDEYAYECWANGANLCALDYPSATAIRQLLDGLVEKTIHEAAHGIKPIGTEGASRLADGEDARYAGGGIRQALEHLKKAKKLGEGGYYEMHEECAKARKILAELIGGAP